MYDIRQLQCDTCVLDTDISSTLVGFAFYSSFFSGGASMLQDEWRHLCLWYHHDLRLRRLYLDGRVLVEEPFLSPRPLFLNGTLVVGESEARGAKIPSFPFRFQAFRFIGNCRNMIF